MSSCATMWSCTMSSCATMSLRNPKQRLVLQECIQQGGEGIVFKCVLKRKWFGKSALKWFTRPPVGLLVVKYYFNENYIYNDIYILFKLMSARQPDTPIVECFGFNLVTRSIVFARCDTDLFEWVVRYKVTENDIELVRTRMMEAIEFCHALSIVHTDIKLENIGVILDERKGIRDIRLLDFGHAVELTDTTQYYSTAGLYGTRMYTYPKVKQYATVDAKTVREIDYWQLGVVLRLMREQIRRIR